MDIFDIFSHGFIQRALIAGSFIAVLCSILGVFLVLRRLSLIGDGLAHVTFGSVAVGLLMRVYPFYVAVPIVMASALGILKLTAKARLYGDAAIGIVSAIGIAMGVIIVSVAGGYNVDLFSYLFGNILAVSKMEVMTSMVLSAALMTIIFFCYRELLFITFDEESARASGIRADRLDKVLVLIIALTVVLAMKVVGIMLVSALLILPPVTALQTARSFKGTICLSATFGVSSVIIGITASIIANLPAGATIVIVNALFFLGSLVCNLVRRGRHVRPETSTR